MMFKYFICISLYFIVVFSVLDYGEFDLVVTEYIFCKGPKRRNCVDIKIDIIGNSSVKYNFNVEEDMNNIKGKILGNMNEQELLRLQIKNVCDHIFLKPLLLTLFPITDRCGIPKGIYKFTVDIQSVARKFYGGKFMYGNWSSKVLFYTDNCNMHCAIINLSLKPKKSNNRETE